MHCIITEYACPVQWDKHDSKNDNFVMNTAVQCMFVERIAHYCSMNQSITHIIHFISIYGYWYCVLRKQKRRTNRLLTWTLWIQGQLQTNGQFTSRPTNQNTFQSVEKKIARRPMHTIEEEIERKITASMYASNLFLFFSVLTHPSCSCYQCMCIATQQQLSMHPPSTAIVSASVVTELCQWNNRQTTGTNSECSGKTSTKCHANADKDDGRSQNINCKWLMALYIVIWCFNSSEFHKFCSPHSSCVLRCCH